MSLFNGSPLPKVAAAAAIVGAIAFAVKAQFDGDPTTEVDWKALYTAIAAGIGLLFARQNNASSEDVGIK